MSLSQRPGSGLQRLGSSCPALLPAQSPAQGGQWHSRSLWMAVCVWWGDVSVCTDLCVSMCACLCVYAWTHMCNSVCI